MRKICCILLLCIATCLYGSEPTVLRLEQQIQALAPIQKKIAALSTYQEKLNFVSTLAHVQSFFAKHSSLANSIEALSVDKKYVIYASVALHQGSQIFTGKESSDAINSLAVALIDTECFYAYMGGIAGYHVKTLELMLEQVKNKVETDPAAIFIPPTVDIRKENRVRNQMAAHGIHAMNEMAEIYVVGGAGDRLNLIDEKTKTPLPVACLNFSGRTLLEQLVRDLEAREYLYYKLTGKQLYTPIVLMTSIEKRNDQEIAAILENNGYFGRPTESIFRIVQPMTPVITIDGNWAVKGPCELVLKPGGHGVIWKLAAESGAYDWLEKQNRSFCLVRQINNPLAGLDHNLLTLAGYGYSHNKGFGFASIPRQIGLSEGMNVMRKTQNEKKSHYSISNIEYTEFAKRKQSDPQFALIADSPHFPANTNILYANIAEIRKAIQLLPVPGYIVNMKQPVETLSQGKKITIPGARLESTMQNIADVITSESSNQEELKTFVLINERSKTMSVTKKAFDGKSMQETPEGCFYDYMLENLKLLQNVCHFEIEASPTQEAFMQQGPNALFHYAPSLGPLYQVIGQKISHGKLARGSEFEVEASEVYIHNLSLEGSLRILAEQPTSVMDKTSGIKTYSPHVGRCTLENVTVKNQGIDHSAPNSYVKRKVTRKESCKIVLQGSSELIAKNLRLSGDQEIVVPDGMRAIVEQNQDGKITLSYQSITEKHPDALLCQYTLNSENQIVLSNRTN